MSGFDEYIRWRCDGRIRLRKHFICAPDGRIRIGHVGRFEKRKRELDCLCQKIGVFAALPHVRVFNTRP